LRPVRGGQFGPESTGQFPPESGGQITPESGGQLHRNFQSYWESWDYKFINKTTGKEEVSFVDYPFISPDKKHIISISANPYNTTADLELYSILNNKVRMIMGASFKTWMPVNGADTMFWSSDGFLYVAALPVSTYWNANGDFNTDRQYIRIKVL
jgi:hypothetical protein